MEEHTSRWRRAAGLMAATALLVAACGGGGGSAAPGESTAAGESPAAGESVAPGESAGGGTGFTCEELGGEITVYATWTGAEQDNFDAMMAPWLECTGTTDELHRSA